MNRWNHLLLLQLNTEELALIQSFTSPATHAHTATHTGTHTGQIYLQLIEQMSTGLDKEVAQSLIMTRRQAVLMHIEGPNHLNAAFN